MTSSNLQAIDAAYQAFSNGDLDAFVDLLDPNFVSTQSDAVPWRGSHHGRDGVRRMFATVASRAHAAFEPREVVDAGDQIVVVGAARITPNSSDQTYTLRELHLWRVQAGALLSLEVFLNAPGELLKDLEARGETE